MRMQRTFKNEKYLWWSIMSILVQVRDLSNPTNDLLLSLAERQITSHYTQLRTAAGITTDDTTPHDKLGVGEISATDGDVENSTIVKAPGRDKGKGKEASATASGTDSPPEQPSSPSKVTLEFDSAHEFFLITRFLELRALQSNAKASTPSSTAITPAVPVSSFPAPSAIVLPSIASDIPLSLQQTLLAHFASKEADKWCERGLGLEIWRREVELQHGSLEGGDWLRSWERLRKSLEGG
jgi:hypothetical protein